MYFGLTIEKLVVIGVIAAMIIGPERLPRFASVLAGAVAWARDAARRASSRLKEEVGPEFQEMDWAKLDPRQFDPRRIVRDALRDDASPRADLPADPDAVRSGGARRVDESDVVANTRVGE